MALDDFSKGYYEKRRAMMGRAPVQDSGDVMRKVNKQVYQAERSRPVLEQAAAEMQTEGRDRSIGERIGKTVSGAAKSYLSSLTNAGGDAARTQGGLWRDFTRDSVREWQQEIDRWERDLSAWRADGSLTREEEEDLTGMIQANREKIATYTMAQGGRRGAAEAARGLADQIALSGARDTDQAKEGIGAAGQFAVDAGTALAQMAGDIALGAVSGGSAMIPMAARSYGGSSQKARLEGASDDRAALYGLASAALETGTELLGNVGRISSKFFGGGAVDDVVEGMVRALERKGGRKVSRALLNRAGTAAAGFVTEGAEEALSAIIDPFLRRAIYSDDPLDAGEILGDALYDFAVGGAVGGIAGGIGGTDTTRGLRSAERNADAAIDRAYDVMGSAGPWSPAAAEAVREANGLLEQAAWAAAETDGISGKAADRILRDESALEQLRQETGLELSNDMTQSERRAAVKQAANWLAVLQKEQGQAGVRAVGGKRESVREERRADGDIGPYGTENRTAGGEKQTAAKRVYDAKRVLDGARAFGESGAKALAAAYDGRTDAESYYGGFAAYYQAGISNMDMRKVRSEYGAQLSEAQKYAAYVAGQNDAILSIQRERQAAPYAKSAGSDSGLVYDDFVRQAVESGRAIEDVNGETRSYLTAETAAKINSVAKSLGVRVQFVDSVRGGTANAQISGSTVLVERNNPNPVMAVVGHEMTHRMQELAPAEYREFRDIIAQEEQSSIQRRVDAYAAQGVALTYEQAMDEVAADYAGRMIDDGKVLDRFIEAHKENRTLLEKVRDAIQAIVRKLTGAEKKQAQTAEGKLTAALEAAAKRTETLQGESSDGTMGATRNSLKDLTEGERSALLQYKSSESYKINAKLRDGISLTEAEQKMVDELDHALEKLSRVEGTVYRRLSFDMEGQEALDAFLSEHAENNFVPYEAYTSGSTAIDGYPVSGELTVTQIISGKTGRDMTGIGNNFESEVVFPRGCDFIVERVTQDAQGNPVIYMKEVEENGIGQLHPEERVQAVQQVQETSKNHDDLHKVSEADTARGSGGKRLSGVRGEGNEEVKFSLKSPVEETKNLIALHNLTEEKLWGDLRLGGFPMPSIAVTRTDVPHTNFGDITLVMDKRSIDPKANRKNTVYSADAWTPTFPQVEYAADPAAERRISGRLRELSGKVDEMFKQDLYRITYDMEDLLNRYGGEEELLRQVMDNYGLKAAYLEDAGHHVSAATVQREADKGYSQDRVEKYRAIVEVLGTDDPDEIGHIPLKELRDRYGDELEAAFPGMTKSTFRLSGIIRQVQAYLQDQGSEPVYETVADAAATRRAIDDALDRDGYERWVRELYSGVQADSGIYNNKERFTPAGNRRTFRQTHYPVTLENIVKAMKGQNGGNTKNVSGFYGVKSLRAGTAKRFKSIADMHKLEGRLQNLTEEQTKAIHDELDRRLMDLTEALAEKSPNGKGSFDYYLADSIGNMLVEIADGEVYTIDAIMGKFNGEYGFHIGNELAAQVRDLLFDVSQMPVNIFEAKPERAVGFDEVLAAVLPDDASGELRDALSGRGVNVLTYKAGDDADRIAKVNGVEGARFSLKEDTVSKNYAAILEENELLRDRVEYWKGQTRRTKRVTTDKKAVSRAAQELIRSYGADLDAGDITQDLQSLYDYVASGYDGKDELTYTEVRRRAEAIAEKLVGNAVAVDETYEQYSDLRAYLRSTTLSLSEEDSRDIPDYGDWRKHQMGRMVIRKGHTNIDQVYQEMSEMWPEFFDEQRENNPVDQLLRIAEVMDGIYNVEEYNPFGPYMQQAITGAANEIMEQFFDLPQTRATFADRQARKLDDTKVKGWERVRKVREQNAARLAELRQQNRERTAKAVERERTRRSEQIGKLKQRYREKDAAGRERRSARELRAKIMRHASALSQKLLRPSDKQHIPENLRQAVAAMLESINLESAYTTDPNTGKRVKDGSGTPTKRTEAFRALRLSYAEIAKDGGDYTLIIDPDLMDNLNELESMKNTPIADMGMDQLTTVWATLKAVEASIRTANKMLGASRFETISGFADGIRSDNILRQDRGDYRGIAGKVDRLVNLDMLTPQGYFHRLGKTGEELFRMMRAAQDRHITIMQQAQDKTAEIIGKTDVNKLEREKHTFELSGGKVTMSTAQIMGLYELMKRKQAQDHILKGGIRPDTISSGRGLREDRRSDPVKVSVDDLATITGTLTEEQIRIADGLQKFMGGKLAELGNEASMAVYGYRKFTEKDYYPIKVDKNQTKRDISKEAQAATIAGRGFTKSVTPKANNAVMLESIFDTYSSHVNDMATYAAWLPTMENIHRIRDFTFRDGEGNRTGDVKSIIERVFGKNGNAYLNKLVDDINQGVRPNGTGNFTDALVGNYKAAAVAANIRVILQQPTAILRAMSSLNPKYLLAGTVKRGDWAKVKKYAPIAVWKDWGYFDINTGRQMKDVLLSSDSVMEKAKQAAMAGAGKADSFAWARLWNAVEAETRDKRPGLKPGTEAFYQAVSTRFSEVVDQTQVVDGLLQRSQIMRSTDALTKMATSFMAEPAKTYNMFVNAVYDLRHATGKDGRSNAKRALARTSAALVVSFAVNAVMQSIVDALRDDDKERDYWEKFLTAYTGFTGEEETALDYWNSFWDGNLEANFNPAGYIPYFKDLVSIMQGYDVSRMDMEPVSKVLEAAANMKKALSGEGKYSVAGASANLLAEVSRLLGIPVANLKRDIQAGITTAAIETDNYLMQYRIDKAMLNMGYQGNTKNFYDILYNASINDREAYETIYADMVASGMPEDKIRNAMESRMKRDQGVESVGDLEQRYLSPIQERSYNSTRNSMAGSSVWTAASRDQQEAVEKDLYDLTVGNDSGEKLQEKIAAGAAYGISEADYLLYRLALHVADQPTESGNLGSYTGEEVQTAIDMLTGLDDEARAYLWEAAGKSEKSNPYK